MTMTEQPLIDLPAREPSPHEAQRIADLLTPFQREAIKDFCRLLKTTPAVECAAMFGDNVRWLHLHRNSAKALAMVLQDRLNEGKRP
jgi:hypothetical protein